MGLSYLRRELRSFQWERPSLSVRPQEAARTDAPHEASRKAGSPSAFPLSDLSIGRGAVLMGFYPLKEHVQSVRIQEALAKVRKEGIHIIQPTEVKDYLQRYPEMIDLLPKVARLARIHLPEAQLMLTLYRDPEIEEEEYLTIDIRLAQYDGSVLERIDAIADLYLPSLVRQRGWIQLTTDFQPPEEQDAV